MSYIWYAANFIIEADNRQVSPVGLMRRKRLRRRSIGKRSIDSSAVWRDACCSARSTILPSCSTVKSKIGPSARPRPRSDRRQRDEAAVPGLEPRPQRLEDATTRVGHGPRPVRHPLRGPALAHLITTAPHTECLAVPQAGYPNAAHIWAGSEILQNRGILLRTVRPAGAAARDPPTGGLPRSRAPPRTAARRSLALPPTENRWEGPTGRAPTAG